MNRLSHFFKKIQFHSMQDIDQFFLNIPEEKWLNFIQKNLTDDWTSLPRNSKSFLAHNWYRWCLLNAQTQETVQEMIHFAQQNDHNNDYYLNPNNYRLGPDYFIKVCQKYPEHRETLIKIEQEDFILSEWINAFEKYPVEWFEHVLIQFKEANKINIDQSIIWALPSAQHVQIFLKMGFSLDKVAFPWTPKNINEMGPILDVLSQHKNGRQWLDHIKNTKNKIGLNRFQQYIFSYGYSKLDNEDIDKAKTFCQIWYDKDSEFLELKNEEGWNLLHYLVLKKSSFWFNLMVELGIDPLQKDKFGRTPAELLEQALSWHQIQEKMDSVIELKDTDEFEKLVNTITEQKLLQEKLPRISIHQTQLPKFRL